MNNIIISFFNQLNESTEYAILHHINNIFSKDDDIDFIVNYKKRDMLNFVKLFVYNNSLCCINHFTIDRDTYRFDLLFYNEENSLEKIELDCVCISRGYDLLEINTKILLQNRIIVKVQDEEFYKISNKDEIEFYIKKKVNKGNNILKYITYFNVLDENFTKEIVLEKERKWKIYYNSLHYRMKYVINKLLLFFSRIKDKPALSICLLGPDGSGKSTIIEKLEKQPIFIYKYYFHLKPFPQKISNFDIVQDPHALPVYSPLKSYAKLLYFIYEYNSGWLKNILRLRIKSSLIIFDRYYDDLLVDHKRYRYGGSQIIAKIVRYFIPKPDLYFILTTDPKIIYKRKQEVSFAELERQVKDYRELADGKQYFNLDVNRTPEEIVKEITHIMMEKMNERY